MLKVSDSTAIALRRPVRCAHCGYYSSPLEALCTNCGAELPSEPQLDMPHTFELKRQPFVVPSTSTSDTRFTDDMLLVLQVLPSAACLTFQLRHPTALGRKNDPDEEHLVSLVEFKATEHGVSRRHCEFERVNDQLFVRDLGSTNGTYLNEHRLIPAEDYVVSHGDRLALGTLHFILAFSLITG